jgi:membrane dipeptidase
LEKEEENSVQKNDTMKYLLYAFLILLLVGAIVLFGIIPGYNDKKMNAVATSVKSATTLLWCDSIPFVADLHSDMLLWDRDFFKEHDYGHEDLPRMRKANMAFQAFTIVSKTPRNMNIDRNDDKTDNIALLSFAQLRPPGTWFSLKSRALHQIKQLHGFEKKSAGAFRVITSQTQLHQFIEDRKKNPTLLSGLLGIEGAHCLGGEVDNLREFYDAGVRYIGLVHFFDNEWAGSAHGVTKGGLTEQGFALLKKMEEMKIIIDLAHASEQTIDEVLAATKMPVIVSHTGVKGVCNNQRNLSDRHLLEIGKRNGLVGIGVWETAVCGTDAVATARSMRYVADKIGADKVCLGSDFDGAITAHFDVTGLPEIAQALVKEGFTRTEVEQIMGGNIRDFFLRNLPEN